MFSKKNIIFLLLFFSFCFAGFAVSYPKIVTINCGKIKVQLSSHTYWNINRLWYEGYYIGEASGYWGTVFAIPGMGLVGSGHLSKKGYGEEVQSIKIYADGKYVTPQEAEKSDISCKELLFEKTAKVKNITFEYSFNLKNNKLYETCKLKTSKDLKLVLMYNFMHPWNRKLSDYYIKVDSSKHESGAFTAKGEFLYEGEMQWITLYDTSENIGIVSKASGDPAVVRLWDRKGNKKIYWQALKNDVMKTGKTYSYCMETDFYRASPETWVKKAENVTKNIYQEIPAAKAEVKETAIKLPENIKLGTPENSFPEFREKAAKLKPYSTEDFALGKKLLEAIREQAKKRKLIYERPLLFARSQPYRSGRLYYCRYSWTDRPLFASRMLWEPGEYDYKDISFRKTLEIFKSYGLDGYSSFIFSYGRTMKKIYDAAASLKLDPEKFHILLGIVPGVGDYKKIDDGSMNLFFNNPYSLRFKGENVAASYVTDRLTPEKVAEYLNKLENRAGGKKVMLIAQIHGYKIRTGWRQKELGDPYDLYLKHGSIPATLLLHHIDYLSKYLRVCGGLDMGAIYNNSSLKVNADYYNDVALPLYAAVIAQDEFNGKKILMNRLEVGYTSFHGSQTISRDGTKTLRRYMDIGIKSKLDILMGTEWDELNEDTNLEPMVAKPMASQRIIKYYSSKLRNETPTPNPGDDLSLPNMIISQRRQLAYGWDVDIELLNVPDSEESLKYSVELELLDQNNKTVFKSGPVIFNRCELKDKTFTMPSGKFSDCQLLQPRLTINYKGKKRVISEGLPFTVMRATACWDHTYFNTPLRNILFPKESIVDFKFTGKKLAPGVKQVSLNASLQFKDELNTLEVVQDSHEIYAYDPENEYLQNDPDRRLYKLSRSYINNPARIFVKTKTTVSNAPSVMMLKTPLDPVNKRFENATVKVKAVKTSSNENSKPDQASDWTIDEIISISKQDIDKAVLTVTGVRTRGQNKGKKFEWSISFSELGEYGVKSKIFEDGLMLALQTQYRPVRVPLPLNSKDAEFKTILTADNPNGILAVRAVSKNGKVYWSKGFTVNDKVSNTKIPVQVYSENKGPVTVNVAENRVPDIKYGFTPKYGNILATSAGREYYAHAGGFLSTAIAFNGLINSRFSIPQCYYKYQSPEGVNKSAPKWVKQPDGKWALNFDGKYGNFLALPNTAVPHRAGFTMSFELKPEVIKPEQIIFAQYGNYLTGFRLSVVNGKFKIEFRRWVPHDKEVIRISKVEFDTKVPLEAGKWQKVVFKYNEKSVSITANGITQSFPCEGISMWLTVSSFGGSGRLGKDKQPLYYQGLLRSLEIKHTASKL
jgi:hypothetical protein